MSSEHPSKTSFQVERKGTRLSGWRRAGTGSRLLLLHGLAGTTQEWEQLLSALDPDLDIVALDFRGHGKSERFPASVASSELLIDCKFVIDERKLEKVIVLGQSMGGILATQLAAKNPRRVAGLILVDSGMSGFGPGQDLSGLRSWVEKQDIDTEIAMRCIKSLNSRDRWDEWQSLTVPTLVCFGERSFISDAEASRMRQMRPDFEYQVVAESGHDIHLDQPLRLATLINSFCVVVN